MNYTVNSGDYSHPSFKINIQSGVTCIGKSAFTQFFELNSIKLPQGLETIEEYAFMGCRSLMQLDLPDSVQNIRARAFKDCCSLKGILFLPEGLKHLGEAAFAGCTGITDVVIPGGIGRIESEAFAACNSLFAVKVSEGITRIDKRAFAGCSSLYKVLLPSTLEYIHPTAFEGCSSLTDIIVPEGKVSDYMYHKDKNLRFRVRDNRTLRVNDECLISRYDGVLHLACVNHNYSGVFHIPDYVKVIDDLAFYLCDKVTDVVFPEGLTTIKQSACLPSVDVYRIPSTVCEMYPSSFGHKVISFPNGSCKFFIIEGSICETLKDGTIRLWRAPIDCNDSVYHMPNGIVSLGAMSCSGVKCKTIILPEGLQRIEECAFSGCSNIKELVIPESVNEFGDECFFQTDSLRTIRMKSSSPESIRVGSQIKCRWWGDGEYLMNDSCTLLVPKGSLRKYKLLPGFDGFSIEEY